MAKQYYSQAGAMSKPKEVTVKKGDTLSGITKREGGTVAGNAKRSGIKNPDLIKPGQKIKIERKMTTTGKTGPSTKRGTKNYSPGAEAIAKSKKSSSSTSKSSGTSTVSSNSRWRKSAETRAKSDAAKKASTPQKASTKKKTGRSASSYAKGY